MTKTKTIGAFDLVVWAFKIVLAIIVVTVPLLSVWLASSLAAFFDGPTWLAILAGLLLCPILPLAWDAWALARRRKKRKTRRPFLTFFDRLLLRTLVLCGVFVGSLLYLTPESAFQALSARGDWMLDGRQTPTAERVRSYIFLAADQLEWLYLATHDNPYAIDKTDDDDNDDTPVRPPPRDGGVAPTRDAGMRVEIRTDAGVAPEAAPDAGTEGMAPVDPPAPPPSTPPPLVWPMADDPERVAVSVPAHIQGSYVSVAQHLKREVPDDFRRAKALHDYVALRVSYDHQALAENRYPPQDPTTVFDTKTAVCAGYARLFKAMADEAGLSAKYVVGRVRDKNADIGGMGHAWNAIELGGHWYLVDVTWDSPNSNVEANKGSYRTDYFLTPPTVFGLDHFPDKPKWQLRAEPISRGDFIRQPMMGVGFYRDGFEMVTPKRSRVDAKGALDVQLRNPKRRFIMAKMLPDGADIADVSARLECDRASHSGDEARVRCRFPSAGVYQLLLFAGPKQFGQYGYVGQIGVTNSD